MWRNIGGIFPPGAPVAAVSRTPNNLDLFITGNDGGSTPHGGPADDPLGDDIRAEAVSITAGSWYAWPSTHVGHELIAVGMLIMAAGGSGKPLDYDELERWTRSATSAG
jgi:hypothetical protein